MRLGYMFFISFAVLFCIEAQYTGPEKLQIFNLTVGTQNIKNCM